MTAAELFDEVLAAQYFHFGAEHGSCRLRRTADELLLLFEWSRGLTDWKNNLDLCPVHRELGGVTLSVHRGFFRAYESVRDRVLCALTSVGIRRLTVGGYSHGAALAALAHADTLPRRRAGTLAVRSVGYGAPRPLFGRCDPEVFAGFTSVICGADLVGHLPPCALGYRHAGDRIHLPTVTGSPIDDHRETSYRTALARSPFGRTVLMP